MPNNENVLSEISAHTIKRYSERYARLGYDIKTLGWGTSEQQQHRFLQTLAFPGLIDDRSILDIGCGFGDYLNFLELQQVPISNYVGVDINPDLIREASARNKERPGVAFSVMDLLDGEQHHPTPLADVGVMLGLLNFRLKGKIDNLSYTKLMLTKAFGLVRHALIVDFLSTHLTPDYPEEDFVFYHDPSVVLGMALELSDHVALKHDYQPIPQREFMLVLKKS